MSPSSYPRVPHLAPCRFATRDDLVLSAEERRRLLAEPVRVEEKLDGANVMLWLDGDLGLSVAGRAGPGAIDRAGQLGRLRAWAADRGEGLRELLSKGRVLYGEWLWLRHGVSYDALPDLLIALDIMDARGEFVSISERDLASASAGLNVPPTLAEGVIGSVEALDELVESSRFAASAPAEGAVIRSLAGDRLMAKRVSRFFAPRTDAEWTKPEKNLLTAGAPSARSS